MSDIAGFPYFEFQVAKDGSVVDNAARRRTIESLAQGSFTDLFVVAHGWNNDMADARDLYKRFFASVRQVMNDQPLSGLDRKFAVLGVLWPSKKFADEDLIPGGAASTGTAISTAVLQKKIEGLRGVFDNPEADDILSQAKELLPQLANSPAAQVKFADLVRSLPGTQTGNREDASDKFFRLSGAEAMERLAKPVMPAPIKPVVGGATQVGKVPVGGAAGIGSFFSGIGSAALNVLNLTTYYQMKERAGMIGRGAVGDLINDIVARLPAVKLHLIGHSFGGRLVTSLAMGREGQPRRAFASLTLLQAAFSHNGFAQNFDGKGGNGFFRDVVSKRCVTGPTIITFSVKDKAVGLAYPLASLVAGQNASGLGDAGDPFGGMGRNGAQHTPEAIALTLAKLGTANPFEPGKVYNLKSDAVISGHSDICRPEVAYALLSAVVKS